jgi:hypothetical protein
VTTKTRLSNTATIYSRSSQTSRSILMVGSRAPVASQYVTTGLKVSTYVALAAQARDELGWLLEQLRNGG